MTITRYKVLSDGMEVGSRVSDVCHWGKCGKAIDRGEPYLCGSYEDKGCGEFFCYDHLKVHDCVPPISVVKTVKRKMADEEDSDGEGVQEEADPDVGS